MSMTMFTLFTSFIWINFFMVFTILLRKHRIFYKHLSISVLMAVIILFLLKVFIIVEFPFTIVISSTKVMTVLQYILRYIIFSFNLGKLKYNISIGHIFIIFSLIVSIIIAFKNFNRCIKTCKFVNFLPQTNDENINKILLTVQDITHFKKKIKIVVHKKVKSPAIIGYFRPIIILPELNFTDGELLGILVHEIMHCKYNHVILKLIIELIRILLWWNPLVYVFNHEVNNILELHADNKLIILLNRQDQEHYLNGIIKVIENCEYQNSLPSISVGLTENTNDAIIKQRFIMILEKNHRKKHKVGSLVVIVSMLIIFIVSYMFVIQPFSEPTEVDYNDGALVIKEGSYIIKNKDNYSIFDLNDNLIVTNPYPITDSYKYLEVKVKNDEKK